MSNAVPPKDRVNQLCETRHGTFLYNKNDNTIGKTLAYYGEHAQVEIELLAQIVKPGDTVIEAGGNIGTHTVPLSRMVGNTGVVYSFEAQRILFQMLCANLALNDIRNVYAYNWAVGSRDGATHVPEIPYDSVTNMGGYSITQNRLGKESVPLVALDSFVKDKQIKRVALIMADIEKMEIDLLRGAMFTIRDHRPVIYMESHDGTPEGGECIRLLRAWGYRVWRHFAHTHNPNNFAGKTEMVMDKNYAAHNILAVPTQMNLECTKNLNELGV